VTGCFHPYREKRRDAFGLRVGHDIATQSKLSDDTFEVVSFTSHEGDEKPQSCHFGTKLTQQWLNHGYLSIKAESSLWSWGTL